MSERAIEAQGADVEAAVEAGLQKLGLGRKDVIVEVVDEGRKGILGLGSKEATVRLTPLTAPQQERDSGRTSTSTPLSPSTVSDDMEPSIPADEPIAAAPAAETFREEASEGEVDEELVSTVTEIVSNLLQKMGFERAHVNVDLSEPDDKTGRTMTVVRVEGENLSALIGPHGDTLNDFQYVARLMAGHALRRRADFIVDIDGYRSQRKESLSSLARRMAAKAVERGNDVTLEPMSSYDRRIIHMALRDRDDVYTSSVGEGSNRRVRIYLKGEA